MPPERKLPVWQLVQFEEETEQERQFREQEEQLGAV
jgi:hypothetical protein